MSGEESSKCLFQLQYDVAVSLVAEIECPGVTGVWALQGNAFQDKVRNSDISFHTFLRFCKARISGNLVRGSNPGVEAG